MTIKEVCERTGITQDTLRYYEKAGVIPSISRSCGGTRCYSEEDLRWVQSVVCLRNAGMSVSGISEYVKLTQAGDETFEKRLHLLLSERERVLEQKKKLETALSYMDYKISRYENAVKTGELVWDEDCLKDERKSE